MRANAGTKGRHVRRAAHFRHISVDTWVGMFFSNLVAFFIIVTTAATLHAGGITKVDTAAQAAEALRPIAGNLAFILFSMGIIGTGLLAVPVLAGRPPMRRPRPSGCAEASSCRRAARSASTRSSVPRRSAARR